eukprot:m.116769 g.116769  ORF g.116769 m.116769 type:complete len:833 (-) comp19444_c0_seq1:36-2534(-)
MSDPAGASDPASRDAGAQFGSTASLSSLPLREPLVDPDPDLPLSSTPPPVATHMNPVLYGAYDDQSVDLESVYSAATSGSQAPTPLRVARHRGGNGTTLAENGSESSAAAVRDDGDAPAPNPNEKESLDAAQAARLVFNPTSDDERVVLLPRPIFSEEDFILKHSSDGFLPEPEPMCQPKACLPNANTFWGRLPIIKWLPHYRKAYLTGDLVAGFTIGIMLIPQGLAYAILSEIPPIAGLYSSLLVPVMYMIFGTCPHLSLGTFALTSLLSGKVVQSLVEDHLVNTDLAIKVASSVALLVGVFQLILFVAKLGFLSVYLSPPFVSGFTTASAFAIASSQMKSFFGISVPRYPEEQAGVLQTYGYIIAHLNETNAATFIIGFIGCVLLYVIRIFNEGGRFHPMRNANGKFFTWPSPTTKKLRIPIPGELVVVVLGTVVSYAGNLEEKYGVKVVSSIPSGLPPFQVPTEVGTVLSGAIGDVITIAIVSFAISASISKTFASRHQYSVDQNQELFAIGLSNTFASFFSTFVSAGSLSRSVLLSALGARTQLHAVVTFLVMLLVLLVLAPLFEPLPNAILAAVIIMALRGLFRQLWHIRDYWRWNKKDLAIWVVTFIATLVFGITLGLAIGVGFSVLMVLYATARPYFAIVGHIAGTELYRDKSRVKDAVDVKGIKIFRFHARLYFANIDYFKSMLYASTVNPMVKDERQDDDPVHTVILDCSPINDVDTAAINTLVKISEEYSARNIRFLLAYVRGPLRDLFTRAKFADRVQRQNIFVSVHDAVLFALRHHATEDYTRPDPNISQLSQEHLSKMRMREDPEKHDSEGRKYLETVV